MSSHRVVIRAFTLRRDVASALVLSRLLEERGCKVAICNSSNFRRYLTRWSPHAVVLNTLSQVDLVSRLTPNAALIHWPGEGGQPYATSDAKIMLDKGIDYGGFDRILVWGQEAERQFRETFQQHEHAHLIVCGNPRLDLVKFNPSLAGVSDRSSSIGVVGRFNSLNHFDGRPALFSLLNPNNVEWTHIQVDAFSSVVKIINFILTETDFDISIRPHPLEAPEQYRYITDFLGSRVSVDNSLDMASWAARQRMVLSPSSTTFLEMYTLGVPAVNIDAVNGLDKRIAKRNPYAALAQEAFLSPRTYDELYALLKSDVKKMERSANIDHHLDETHNWFSATSALEAAANHIVAAISERSYGLMPHVPHLAMEVWDWLRFWRHWFSNRLYPNFNYLHGYHKASSELMGVVENIANGRRLDFTKSIAQ